MHVGHMACHVSICMTHLKAINMMLFVERKESKEKEEMKGERDKKKGKKERTNRFSSD